MPRISRIVSFVLVSLTFSITLLWSMSSTVATPTVAQAYASSVTVNNSANPAAPAVLVLRLYFSSAAQRDHLASEWGAVEARTDKGYLTIWADRPTYQQMLSQNLRVEIDQAATAAANRPVHFGSADPNPLSFYGGYKTVEEMQAFLDAEVAAHPSIAEKVDIGDSWCKAHAGSCTQPSPYNGYDIYSLHIGNRSIPGPKPVFWYDAAIHAREIAAPEVAMRYIDYLLSNYDNNADAHWLVDWNDIWVTPMANPDGHHIVEAGGNNPYYQRKNANNTNGCTTWPPGSSTQFGTDLNRNFAFKWNCCGGSSSAPCNATYHGSGPASEPETLALANQISSLIPDQRGPGDNDPAPLTTTGVMITMHSYAQLVTAPWGWTNNQAPNGPDMLNLANHMVATNAGGNGYQACNGTCPYAVDGASDDWTYGTLGAPAFTIELSDDGGGFFPAYSYTQNTIWPENQGTLLYAAKIARIPLVTSHGPDANNVTAAPLTVTQGISVHLSANINYAWTGNNFSQNVGAAEYYVDNPPWAGGAPTAMSPSDGNFNSPTEGAVADIDTSSLALGRHLIFVRGRGAIDYSGFPTWGAFSAVFVTVLAPATPTPGPSSTPMPTATPGGPTDTPAPPSATPTSTSTPLSASPTVTVLPATDTPAAPTATPTSPLPTATAAAPTPTDCPNAFVDVTGNVFYGAIHYLACRGVVNGVDATHYGPSGTSTRGQFAKVVVLGFGYTLFTPVGIHQDFSDVPPSYFAYVYVETGYHNGILSGFDAQSCVAAGATYPCYLPNRAITRAQLTKLVVNAAAYPLYTPTAGQSFSDVPPSNVFYVSIETAHHQAVINGYPDGSFRPNNNIRRDEMAQIVYGAVTRP